MADYATVTEIKDLIRGEVNKIKGLKIEFTESEGTESYKAAKQDCGFAFPALTDEKFDVKCKWLKERMRRWFIWQLWNQHTFRFDMGDAKASQVVKNLQNLIAKMDEDFSKAKEDKNTAEMFITAADIFGSQPLVVAPGFEEDRLGIDITIRT